MLPKSLVYLLCSIPWILGLIVIFFILSLRFPINGIFIANSDLSGASAFIYQFLPAERTILTNVSEHGFLGQRIIEDPVYINARVPGPYPKVEVEMEFKVMYQPLVELGIIRDKFGKQMDMVPWYSAMLESTDWLSVTSPKGKSGYIYKTSARDRLDDPDTRNLAVWLATTTMPMIADLVPIEKITYEVSLRGQHDLWVVPAGGGIDIELKIQDVNRNRSGGLLAIEISKNGQVIKYDAIGVSGSLDTGYSNRIPVAIKQSGLDPGVYRIRLLADDDIFIREISTTNPRFVIGPRLHVGDVVGFRAEPRPFIGYTTARHIVAETFHKEGLQEIIFGPISGKILQTHTAVRIDRADDIDSPVKVIAPVGDVRLISDGFFALSESAYFEPEPRRLKPETNGTAEGLKAVLTDYKKIEQLNDGWMRAKADFTIPESADMIRLVLSAPGIGSRAGSIDIRSIKFTYIREPMNWKTWWQVLYKEIKNAWNRL